MTRFTSNYGFPFEHFRNEEPGHTLDGGATGNEPILAEAVENKILDVDTEIASIKNRLDLLEAGTTLVGWVPIQSGSNTGFEFDIDLTDGGRFNAGDFELIRLHLRFDLSATGMVTCRINNDSSSVYNTAMRALDAANPSGDFTSFPITQAGQGIDILEHFSAASQWRLGHGATVSTNNLMATFFHMSGNFNHSYQSESSRHSTSATTTARTWAWGYLESAVAAVPSSLRIHARELSGAGIEFSNAWWWVEGYRLPA